MKHQTREAWLLAAVEKLRPLFASTELTVPATIKVSVGFPSGGGQRGKHIGQCWPTKSGNGINQVFVSPTLSDPVLVLDTLLHELIHAADDCKSGHRGAFTRTAKALGRVGRSTCDSAGPELKLKLGMIADQLGEYPHPGLSLNTRLAKPQTTRMIKTECPETGYLARTTQKWLDAHGAPICPCCGIRMAVDR